MNKKILIPCAIILIVGIYWFLFDGSGQGVTLTILHLNDGESQLLHAGKGIEDFGGAARSVTVVKNLRSAATTDVVLTLSSGDNFLAGPEFKASLAAYNPALGGVNIYYDAKALDAIGYDAILLGNHDFDFGPNLLADFISTGFTNTFPPYLSANIDFTGEPALQALVESGRIARSVVIEKNGYTFGIIGATTPNLPFISRPANAVVDANLVTVVQNEINTLLKGGINKIIFVSHLQDLADDMALIAQLSGVDIAVTGGSNDVLANSGDLLLPGDMPGGTYPIITKDLSDRQVSIVTTGGEYKYVGRLMVEFDKTTGEITKIDPDSGPIRVAGGAHPDAVMPDSQIQVQVTEPVQAFVAELETNIIARSEVALDGMRRNVRSKETNAGDLVADALLSEARRLSGNFGVKTPTIALTNGGSIRNNTIIPAGNISVRDTYDMVPFPDFISVFEKVSLTTFKELLENAVSRIDDKGHTTSAGTGRFAHVAGFSFEYDPSRQAIEIDNDGNILTPGKRVTRVILDDETKLIDAGTVVVDPSYTLTIATIDYLARGGDQYPFGDLAFINLHITCQDALSNYIRQGLGGVISALDYPEGGKGRIARLPNTHSP
ncbi:MAG: 5'-nucleotidase C-terminal domain-containing protein [Desulfobacterales bacterium]|jgi:5'-nucleotidase